MNLEPGGEVAQVSSANTLASGTGGHIALDVSARLFNSALPKPISSNKPTSADEDSPHVARSRSKRLATNLRHVRCLLVTCDSFVALSAASIYKHEGMPHERSTLADWMTDFGKLASYLGTNLTTVPARFTWCRTTGSNRLDSHQVGQFS